MNDTARSHEKVFLIQRWVKGWGWLYFGKTPIREQAEDVKKALAEKGLRVRVKEERDEEKI